MYRWLVDRDDEIDAASDAAVLAIDPSVYVLLDASVAAPVELADVCTCTTTLA